jgi:hypothetical protein
MPGWQSPPLSALRMKTVVLPRSVSVIAPHWQDEINAASGF